jgi:DNA repair exonuclease SbcCD ATPase subunit
MEFDELLITTGVDALIRLVQEKKHVELNMAAKLLGIPPSQIEDWAHVLEDEKVLRIEYKLTEVNLVWVAPSVEEVRAEKAEFVRRKAAVDQDLKRLEDVQRKGKDELRAQAESIEKMYSHFEDSFRSLEELSRQVKGVGEKRGEVSKQAVGKVDELAGKVAAIRESVGMLEKQLRQHKAILEKEGAGKKASDLEAYKKHVDELTARVAEVLKKTDDAVKRAPKGAKADTSGLEGEMKRLEAEYRKVRDESRGVKELISEFRQSAEVLQTVKELMGNVSQSSGSVRTQLEGNYAELEAIRKNIPEIEKHLKADLELVAQYEDALKVAHDVMGRLPDKEELMHQVQGIERREEQLADEYKRFEKNLGAVTGNVLEFGEVVGELTKLRDDVDKVNRAMAKQSKEIMEAMEEETSTYSTFQKIKAKTKLSVDQYLAQLERINEESEAVSKQLDALRGETARKLGSLSDVLGSENVRDAVKLLEGLEEKRKGLEQVRALITELNEKSARIEKNIRILGREAELISLREGAPGTREREERAERIRLTEEEQDEFERKRKELKDLIKRLWEAG